MTENRQKYEPPSKSWVNMTKKRDGKWRGRLVVGKEEWVHTEEDSFACVEHLLLDYAADHGDEGAKEMLATWAT